MERTLSIQVLGAVGSGKTKLLALITTLLRKEGVLIVGTTQETVCAESQQVKFDVEAHSIQGRKTLTCFERMIVTFDDASAITVFLRNAKVEVDGDEYRVTPNNTKVHAFYKVGFSDVVAITLL